MEGKGQGGGKDDSQVSGLSDWWTAMPFSETERRNIIGIISWTQNVRDVQ